MVDYNYYSGGYGSGDYGYTSSSSSTSSSSNSSSIGPSGYTSVDAIASQSSSGLGSRQSSRLDKKGYTPTKSTSTASGVAYQNMFPDNDDDGGSPAVVIPAASAVATQQAGGSPHNPAPSANPMSWYASDAFNVPAAPVTTYQAPTPDEVQSYVYRAQQEMQSEEINNLVSEAMGYSTPSTGLTIVEDRPLTAEEREKWKPLLDMAKDRVVPSITTTELPSMEEMQQREDAAIKDAIKKIQQGVPLDQVLTNITEVAYRGEKESGVKPLTVDFIKSKLGEVDPETGQPIQSTADVVAKQVSDKQGLMSRSSVPTGSIEEAVATNKNFLETPTFKLLEGVEGFKSEPYSLNNKETLGGKPHKSGLTVGAGIDFGQHSEQALLDMGVPKTMVDKAKDAGWIGLNPDTIVDPKTGEAAATRSRGHKLMYDKFLEQKKAGTLPTFTKAELSQATPPVYQKYEDAAKTQFENDTGLNFDDLNEGSKAVLTLEKYHRGVDYILPEAMLIGAAENNPEKAAAGIKNPTRRKNVKAWVKKVGIGYNTRIETSPRPMLRPTK